MSYLPFVAAFCAFLIGACQTACYAADPNVLPFSLSWTHGTCHGCQTAKELSDVEFVGPNDAWGLGYVPPGTTGAGDYVIVHTHDGGKTWAELPSSYEHNSPPSVSFVNQREGWVMIFDMSAAEQRLLATNDGGAHWNRLSLRAPFVEGIQYLGGGVGHAYGFDIYAKQGYLYETSDNGRHWNKTLLPERFSPERLAFTDATRGVLAGCLDHKVVVVRTADNGKSWDVARVDLPVVDADPNEYCSFDAHSLSLVDPQHGWLLINKHSFMLGDERGFAFVAETSDGGTTWVPAKQEEFSGAALDFSDVKFLSRRFGFISKYPSVDAAGKRKAESETPLFYTTDEGVTWKATQLPRGLESCHVYLNVLGCAASDFWVLRISIADDR